MNKLILLLSLLFLSINANAQLQKIIHQSFDIDQITTISLDIQGEYEIEKWAGNTILTETHIQLYDASPSILRYFVEQEKRYDIIGSVYSETSFSLVSFDKVRKPLKTKYGEAFEFVKVRILVPEEFNISDPKTLVKNTKQEEMPVTAKEQ
jgi:hypothetical protein